MKQYDMFISEWVFQNSKYTLFSLLVSEANGESFCLFSMAPLTRDVRAQKPKGLG